MKTITETLMDKRANITTAAKGLIGKGPSLTASLVTLVIGGAAVAGYILVNRFLRSQDNEETKPKLAKKISPKSGKKTKAVSKSKSAPKTTTATLNHGKDQHFIPAPGKRTGHSSADNSKHEVAMRYENQKVKAAAIGNKQKVLRIPSK